MFTLVTDRSKYFRVKRGQTKTEVEAELNTPLKEFFYGAVCEVIDGLEPYIVQPMESYETVARKTGASVEKLKRINFSRPLYPTCKLFVPCKK